MAFFNRKELEKALKYWYDHQKVNDQEQNEAVWCAINAIKYCIEHDSDYPDEDKKCKTCKYYLYGFESYPCAHCQRNFLLVNEIREQQNDFWKDGTPHG